MTVFPFIEYKPRPAFFDRARCTTEATPVAFFFPENGTGVKAAQTFCQQCPVRIECLAYALTEGEPWGIWGGWSQRQRAAFGRQSPTRKVWGATSPHGDIIRDVLADGNWHSYDDLYRACRPVFPDMNEHNRKIIRSVTYNLIRFRRNQFEQEGKWMRWTKAEPK
jgi:WhiB family redox-sensing transcriptional regulator